MNTESAAPQINTVYCQIQCLGQAPFTRIFVQRLRSKSSASHNSICPTGSPSGAVRKSPANSRTAAAVYHPLETERSAPHLTSNSSPQRTKARWLPSWNDTNWLSSKSEKWKRRDRIERQAVKKIRLQPLFPIDRSRRTERKTAGQNKVHLLYGEG